MPKNLYELEAHEVSLVPKGANKRKFMIFKSAEQKQLEKELKEMIEKADPEVAKKIEEILKNFAPAEGGQPLDARSEAALKAVGRILAPFKGQIPKEALAKVLAECMGKDGMPGEEGEEEEGAEGKPAPKAEEGKNPFKKEDTVTDEHHKQAVDAAEKIYKEEISKLGYTMYPDFIPAKKEPEHTPKGDKVEKNLIVKEDGSLDLTQVPEALRPSVEAVFKSQQEANAKLEEVKKEAEKAATEKAALEAEKVEKELTEKAGSFEKLGAKSEDVKAVLKALHGNKEASEKLESILKGCQEKIEKGDLFKENGSSQPMNQDMWPQIEAAAMSAVAKSGEKVSKEQAVDKFLQTPEGKKMYAQYTNEGGK